MTISITTAIRAYRKMNCYAPVTAGAVSEQMMLTAMNAAVMKGVVGEMAFDHFQATVDQYKDIFKVSYGPHMAGDPAIGASSGDGEDNDVSRETGG